MEVIKKTILQALTTGTTATTEGIKYIIIPDLTAVYYTKFGLNSMATDIGFFDADTTSLSEPIVNPPIPTTPITGTSKSRLLELRKYTVTNVFSKQYITGGTTTNDGVDLSVSNTGSSVTYYIGGIEYIDMISGSSSGITYNIFLPQGMDDTNFINVPYYKNPNKENIVDRPKIDDDVFILRQELSAFDGNYRLEYIKNLTDLTTYAGGNFFNIVNNG